MTDTQILMDTQIIATEIMKNDRDFKDPQHFKIHKLVSKKINSLQVVNTANTI